MRIERGPITQEQEGRRVSLIHTVRKESGHLNGHLNFSFLVASGVDFPTCISKMVKGVLISRLDQRISYYI